MAVTECDEALQKPSPLSLGVISRFLGSAPIQAEAGSSNVGCAGKARKPSELSYCAMGQEIDGKPGGVRAG